MLLGQAPDARRQREIREIRNLARDDSERDRDRAALPEAVDAEAREPFRRVGAVELSGLEERLQTLRRLGADLLERQLEISLGELCLAIEFAQAAVAANDRRPFHLEVDIAGAEFNGAAE